MKIGDHRVMLRTPVPGDLPYIRGLWADTATMRDVGGPIVIDEERARRWFERMIDPGSARDRYFLICGTDGAPVGEISFHRYDPVSRTAELNIKIEANKRYQGHGPEALRLLLGYFFDTFGGEAMLDPVAPGNTNGRKAMQRAGFKHDPSREDVFLLRMTKRRYHTIYN